MAHVDFKNRSITAKVVYYGCGLCGKTTNLEYINGHSKDTSELLAVSTEGDRTIFFDFMPMKLGTIRGIDTQFKLYAVPGQVRYNMTRKLVLKDVDGVVFVVDSQKAMLQANIDSLANLEENLREFGIEPGDVPIVFQYNKRDLDGVMSVAELDSKINTGGLPSFEGCAISGEGVFETLDCICRSVFDSLWRSMGGGAGEKPAVPVPQPSAPAQETPGPSPVAVVSASQPSEPAEPEGAVASASQPSAPAEPEGAVASASQPSAPAEPEGAVASAPQPSEPDEPEGAVDSASQPSEPAEPEDESVQEPDVAPSIDAAEPQGTAAAEAPADDAAAPGAATPEPTPLSPSAALPAIEKLVAVVDKLERLVDDAREIFDRPVSAPRDDGSTVNNAVAELEEQLAAERNARDESQVARRNAEKRARELANMLRESKQRLKDAGARDARASAAVTELEAARSELAEVKAARERAEKRVRELETRLRAPPTRPVEEPAATTSPARTPAAAPAEREELKDQAAAPAQEAGRSDAGAQPAVAETAAEPTLEAPAAGAELAPEAPPSAEPDPFADDRDHQNARRVARVMVGDLLLYHRDQFLDGIRSGDVEAALEEPLAEARKTYESRIAESVRSQRDYLALDLERAIDDMREEHGLAPAAAPPAPEEASNASPTDPPPSPEPGAPNDASGGEGAADAERTEQSAAPPADAGGVGALPPAEEGTAPTRDDAAPAATTAEQPGDAPAATAAEQPGDAPSAPQESEAATSQSDAEPAEADPFADDREHQNARRIARVMVADLLLYNRDLIFEGIENGNVHEVLQDQLDEARKTFEARVAESIRSQRDYLAIEFDRLVEQQTKEARGS